MTLDPLVEARTIKERGILFSAPMVKAILDGRKSMTRRLIKQTPIASGIGWNVWYSDKLEDQIDDGGFAKLHAPYQVGDRLYVKEAWRTRKELDGCAPSVLAQSVPIHYEADGAHLVRSDYHFGRYRHARFMPRTFSRITLEVTGVRCERLQGISEEDAVAEGIRRPEDISAQEADVYEGAEKILFNALNQPGDAFRRLWESIHGEGSWQLNPWLWVYEFKRLNQS